MDEKEADIPGYARNGLDKVFAWCALWGARGPHETSQTGRCLRFDSLQEYGITFLDSHDEIRNISHYPFIQTLVWSSHGPTIGTAQFFAYFDAIVATFLAAFSAANG